MKFSLAFFTKALAVAAILCLYLIGAVTTAPLGASSAAAQPRRGGRRRTRRRRRRRNRGAGAAAGAVGIIIGGVIINELSKEQRRQFQERCERWQRACDDGNNGACANFDEKCVADDKD